jgi:hypothetical protein
MQLLGGGGFVLLQVIEYSRMGNGAYTLETGMTLGTDEWTTVLGLAPKTKRMRNRTYSCILLIQIQ